MPQSFDSILRQKTAWLARPGFPALLEIQERPETSLRAQSFVSKIELPGIEQFEGLLSAIPMPFLSASADGQAWLTLRGERRFHLSSLVEGKDGPSPASMLVPQPRIETERLILAPYEERDIPDIFAYASNPEVTKYLLWNAHASVEDSRQFYQWVRRTTCHTRGKIFFVFAIRLKSIGKVIGSIDFKNPQPWVGQIDYALSADHWNQGLTTEAASALRDWSLSAFGDMQRFQAYCYPENTGSRRVMEKIGMAFEGIRRKSFLCKGKVVDLAHYALTRDSLEQGA